VKPILNPDHSVEIPLGSHINRLDLDSKISRQRRIDGEDKQTRERDVARAKSGDSGKKRETDNGEEEGEGERES